jgi:nitrite reductase/ring-hydroxylating ferredoxin subunit
VAREIRVGPASELQPPKCVGGGNWAVGKSQGEYFAVSRHCRHLFADLAGGVVDKEGCLVCPWHGSRYDVKTGRMVRGPRGVFAKIPGLDLFYVNLTKVWPLSRGEVVERKGELFVR